ncbi:TVA4 protein, partial [Psophia crepitans]|nr:TVA4 protein [Psophia crepitans]
FLAVAVGRALVQQELSAETTKGTNINLTCSHRNIQTRDLIYWYCQLPGQGPTFLMSITKDSKEVPDLPGWLLVVVVCRSSVLRLARPRCVNMALYYCALG